MIPLIVRILYGICIVFFYCIGRIIISRFANDDHVNYDLHDTDSKKGSGKNKTNQCLEMFPKLYLNSELKLNKTTK
jgi:hypothetical protein